MGVSYYDEIEIEDMTWDDKAGVYHYPCPCGDRFEISRAQLAACEDIATCPSCSLIIRVVFDPLDFEDYEEDEDDDAASVGEDSEPQEEEDKVDLKKPMTTVITESTALTEAVENLRIGGGKEENGTFYQSQIDAGSGTQRVRVSQSISSGLREKKGEGILDSSFPTADQVVDVH